MVYGHMRIDLGKLGFGSMNFGYYVGMVEQREKDVMLTRWNWYVSD